MWERAKVGECLEGCAAEEAGNPPDLVEKYCASCPWSSEFHYDSMCAKISYFVGLMDVGCPIQRNELTNEEWFFIGLYDAERKKFIATEGKQ